MTVGIIGDVAPSSNPDTYVWAVNWAIAYELPNSTETTAYYHAKKHRIHTHMLQRKHRRDLYGKLETILDDECAAKDGSRVLSRRKRYVAFPEGSSFSCAGCVTVGVIGQPAPTSSAGMFTWGMNWGIAYELPNSTETSRFFRRFKGRTKPIEQRRSRRELYQKLETIISNMGYNGRECILKTLCETTQRIVPHGGNMIEEMFRTLFSMPLTRLVASEPLEHAIYDSAHRLGTILDNCDRFHCPISLVDLVKGYYNAPSPKVDTALNPWALFSSSFG